VFIVGLGFGDATCANNNRTFREKHRQDRGYEAFGLGESMSTARGIQARPRLSEFQLQHGLDVAVVSVRKNSQRDTAVIIVLANRP
jgi:hypothetical protein